VTPPRSVRSRHAVVLLAAATTAIVLVAGCSGGDDGGGTSTTAPVTTEAVVTTAPQGRPPGAVETGLRELATGQCFDTIDDPTVRDLAVWVLDCGTPHTYEVYDVVAYDGDGAGRGTEYPGVAVVQDWSEQACFDRFEPFVGVRWTVSELDIAVWWPSEESWARADRTVICAVMSDAGDPLTGTQRGTAR
jgi:hypothetical protein